MSWEQIAVQGLAQIVPALAVALLVAAVSSSLALRAFYRQRWWDTKKAAYLELLNAIHVDERYAEVRWSQEIEGAQYDADFLAELEARAAKARRDIQHYRAIADVVFNPVVAGYIDTYFEACEAVTNDPKTSFASVMDTYMAQDQKLMAAIKRGLRADLQLPH